MLELRTVGARLPSKSHESLGAFEVAIMIRRDVCDEVSRFFWAD